MRGMLAICFPCNALIVKNRFQTVSVDYCTGFGSVQSTFEKSITINKPLHGTTKPFRPLSIRTFDNLYQCSREFCHCNKQVKTN